jgi:hypothetical protein
MKLQLALIVLAAAMSGCQQTAQPQRVVTLPSGKQVRVLGVVQWKFSQGPPALMLQYQTDLKVSDVAALKREVEEIWPDFRKDVENGGYQNAIISANEVPQGLLIKKSQSYNFVFERSADGTWRMLESNK